MGTISTIRLGGILAALGLFGVAGAAAPARAGDVTTTSYSQMVGRIDRDCAQSPLIRVAPLGKSASGDRTLWMVRLADPGTPAASTRKLLILCRQHGDEPVNTEAVLNVLDRLADGSDPQAAGELKKVTVYIIPMVNPDGADADTRDNANDADLNRDWGIFHNPETRAVYGAYLAIRPQMVLDMHSWDEGDPFRGYCLEAPREDVCRDQVLGNAARALQARGSEALFTKTGQQIAETNYGISAEMTLCHRFFLVRENTVSLLFETQPDNGGQPFSRRVEVAQAAISWIIGDLANSPSWTEAAAAERRDRPAASRVSDAPAKLTFLASAIDQPPPSSSAISSAVRIMRSTARRIPAAVWWALGIYLLLWVARPIFAPVPKPSPGDGASASRRNRFGKRSLERARGRTWRKV